MKLIKVIEEAAAMACSGMAFLLAGSLIEGLMSWPVSLGGCLGLAGVALALFMRLD